MSLEEWRRVEAKTIATAQRFATVLAVFETRNRSPELATGVLIEGVSGPILVTARHVIERLLKYGADGRLQIGTNATVWRHIPPERISLGKSTDIGSVALLPEHARELPELLSWEQIAQQRASENMLVAFVGFPGQLKELDPVQGHLGLGQYTYYGYVETAEDDQFSVRVEETHQLDVTSSRESFASNGVSELGGISGAPVFSAADHPKLVGIVFEGKAFSNRVHKIYAAHVNCLAGDGQIMA